MNTTENSMGFKGLVTAAAISQGQRIKISSGQADIAAATDAAIGVAIHDAASGGVVTVKLWSAPGTFICRASAPIAAGAQLYPTAAGEVDDTGTTAINLVALEAAAADNNLIECARIEKGA
ncbi:MAG: DUF2190 family protein [Verrucomicrobia bacterium]|nr:DUF2190 family protein [Verrucomicrobiota bacterium]